MRKRENKRDQEIIGFRALLADEGKRLNPHLDSDLGFFRYLSNADQIKTYLPKGKVLDWGCGLGQMTYLLKNRGLEMVSYDVDQSGRDFLDKIGQTLILATDPIKLPFADNSFDAVLSSGVLEHVPDPVASLKEIARIVKNNGYLFIFRLPNKYSYIEFFSDCFRRGDHPTKYTKQIISLLLNENRFESIKITYQGLLPYNLKGFPSVLRKFYHRFDRLIASLDAVLSCLPLLKLFSTNLGIIARKKDCDGTKRN